MCADCRAPCSLPLSYRWYIQNFASSKWLFNFFMFSKMILLATSTLFCAVSPFVAVSGGFGRFINPSETDGQYLDRFWRPIWQRVVQATLGLLAQRAWTPHNRTYSSSQYSPFILTVVRSMLVSRKRGSRATTSTLQPSGMYRAPRQFQPASCPL